MGRKPGYDHQSIEDHFEGHNLPPEIREKFLDIKAKYKKLAHEVLDTTPSSPHQTRSINLLMQSKDAACMALIMTWVERDRRISE